MANVQIFERDIWEKQPKSSNNDDGGNNGADDGDEDDDDEKAQILNLDGKYKLLNRKT